MRYWLLTDAEGVVTGACPSEIEQPGAVEVDATIYDRASAALLTFRLVDGTLVDYAPPPPPIDLAAYAKEARNREELGGIIVGGVPVLTDDRSKMLLMGARLRAEKDPNLVERFAAADGARYPLPAASIIAISDALGEHVSRCFRVYDEVESARTAEPPTVTSTAQIDAAFTAIPIAY